MLRDMGIAGISVQDGRHLEVVATGSPLAQGIPLAVDATMVSVLHANGDPWARADVRAAVAIERAEKDKDNTYPELVQSAVAKLTTLACETGGRWSAACHDVVTQLATARARAAPNHLQLSARLAYEARWWAILSCAQQDALAATLVDDGILLIDGHDGMAPELVEVLVDQRHSEKLA